ncbi:hypothetical protein EON66_04525 [archaeon]|nr:MAG: hypothetical protein EON66_04525 [archaeon]
MLFSAAVLACACASGSRSFDPFAPNVISTIAGTGARTMPPATPAENIPATRAYLGLPIGASVCTNPVTGVVSLFISEYGYNTVRLVSGIPGNISAYAGKPVRGADHGGYAGDGGPAAAALLNGPGLVSSVSIPGSGGCRLYIPDTGNNVIRMVNEAGIISTVAGCPKSGCTNGGIGLSATATSLNKSIGVAALYDANTGGVTLYIADAGNYVVRRVDEAGNMYVVAGNGSKGFSGDGGPALAATLREAASATPYANPSTGGVLLFIADTNSCAVRRVGEDGIISTVAGTGGVCGYAGDGGPATAALLFFVFSIAVLPDAQGDLTLYIADIGNAVIRFVNAAGIISTIVGNGTRGYSGDGGSARQATFYSPSFVQPVVLQPGGPVALLINDVGNNAIRLVQMLPSNAPPADPVAAPPIPPAAIAAIAVAAGLLIAGTAVVVGVMWLVPPQRQPAWFVRWSYALCGCCSLKVRVAHTTKSFEMQNMTSDHNPLLKPNDAAVAASADVESGMAAYEMGYTGMHAARSSA